MTINHIQKGIDKMSEKEIIEVVQQLIKNGSIKSFQFFNNGNYRKGDELEIFNKIQEVIKEDENNHGGYSDLPTLIKNAREEIKIEQNKNNDGSFNNVITKGNLFFKTNQGNYRNSQYFMTGEDSFGRVVLDTLNKERYLIEIQEKDIYIYKSFEDESPLIRLSLGDIDYILNRGGFHKFLDGYYETIDNLKLKLESKEIEIETLEDESNLLEEQIEIINMIPKKKIDEELMKKIKTNQDKLFQLKRNRLSLKQNSKEEQYQKAKIFVEYIKDSKTKNINTTKPISSYNLKHRAEEYLRTVGSDSQHFYISNEVIEKLMDEYGFDKKYIQSTSYPIYNIKRIKGITTK